MKKELCFGTPPGVWAGLLTLSLRKTQFGSFTDLSRFSHFFGNLLFFSEENTNFLRFCTKFSVKVGIILCRKCTS